MKKSKKKLVRGLIRKQKKKYLLKLIRKEIAAERKSLICEILSAVDKKCLIKTPFCP